MRESGPKFRIQVSAFTCFWLALIFLLLPLTWAAAWLLAMAVHEAGHLLAAAWAGVPVYCLYLGPGGARIETGPMTLRQELLCAAAGPIAGGLMLFLGRWLPMTAFFALIQSLFNLLPFGTLDGGRILRCASALRRKTPCKPAQERVQ